MASINTIVKRKQYLWLGIVVVGTASAIGGALYLSDVDMSGNGETVAEQEPVPDMTGVVDTTFDDKVRQHATTEMQVTAAQMQKQYEEIRRELDVLNKQRGDDQRRIEKLGQDNAALAEQVKALGANPVTATGEPVPQMPASPPGPEGEPQLGNTPVSFPPQGSVAVPPPTAFYPGNGVTPPPQVTYQSVPVPNRIQRKVFTRNEGKQGPSLPYIPSGSFAKAMLIEGADANASVTGNESTVPMQLRITGLVEMPNSKTYDATGCFVGLEAWGDVSSERAIVRTRNISCLKDGKTIDMPIKGHVSFRGKNGIKGEVVMRNGKILGWAWGAGFVDGIGQGMERASQPAVGLGATAAYGAGDVLKMGIGGGASKAAQTLSDYYIKRAEQYHPVIPIGAGNEVTVVFQDGFQLKTVEEMALERTQNRAEEDNPESPVPVPPSAESHLNGFNTDQMLKQLGNLNPQQFMSGSQGGATMANNMSSRQACHAARYVVARVLRGLFWCLKYTVILPLATMALMALFVLWKDNTTPGKLLVKEINFVRQTAPAGQFPVSECWFSSSDSSGRSEIQDICHYRAADAADYVRETDRSLMQLVTALWATLALMYVSLAAITGKYPVRPGKMKCIRVVTADEHLKEVYTEDASLPGKIRKCPVYLPDDRTNRNNGDKNEHA
ncbi:F-type conjugal transfer pilus assembly protein TraB [Escherichia coli]|nr:F-type conjugal transfer pilus assembly protein TraB [Escherichia coli]EJQ0399623.1 F-type conjugal transfer pilus assembly protein TraB [Escherichia coli]